MDKVNAKVKKQMVIDALNDFLKEMEQADKGVVFNMYHNQFCGYLNASYLLGAISNEEREAFLNKKHRIADEKKCSSYC